MILDDLLDVCDLQTKAEKAEMIDEIIASGGGQIINMIFDDMVKFNLAVVRLPEMRFYDKNLETPSNEELENILTKIANRDITGNAALNCCANFGNRLKEEPFAMFCDILQSNPRLGIGATDLNKRCKNFKVDQFKVHLCKSLKDLKGKGKIQFQKIWLVQPKIDGNRLIGKKNPLTKLLSRKGHENTSLNHIINILNKTNESFATDGEAEYLDSLEATGAIRRKNKQVKTATYTLFGMYDIKQWNSEKHTDRYEECYDRALKYVESLSFEDQQFIRIVPSFVIGSFENEEDWLTAVAGYYDYFLELGYEGIVAKTVDHVYEPSTGSKRSVFTIKSKPWIDADATVVGVNESKTNPDTFGSFQCIDRERREFDCAPGNFTKDELDYIWKHQYKFIDKTLELKYQGFTIHNSYRHPNAVKFRDDV